MFASRPAAVALAAGLALALAACAPGRAIDGLAMLRDVAAGQHAGTASLGPHPTSFEAADGHRREADLYHPPGSGRAAVGLVLVPGATPQGRRDPRLVAFARELAAADFAVLVPALPGLRRLRVDAGHAGPIGAAVRHLAARTSAPDGGQVGLAAISYAAGPAVLAALRPQVRSQVGFLLLVGPYYDVESALTFVTTGAYRPSPQADWHRRQPNPRGKWAFVAGNADRLRSPRDAALLRAIARRKLADPGARIAELEARLGPAGRAVLALATNTDPGRVPALIAEVPADLRRRIADLDLSRRDLGALPGPILLVHGRDDPVVPHTESQRLAAALPAGRAELYLVSGLLHADLESVGIGDSLRLWRLAYRLLTLRDHAPAVAREPRTQSLRDEPS